jgi:DNA-directed RNA polymerase, mitochondrial
MNIMTIPYGGTSYGLGSQQLDDAAKHGIDLLLYIEPRWASFMGRLVYEDCLISLERLMQLLSIFEKTGELAEKSGKFLKWTVPITNFPVVQHYIQGEVRKTWVLYGPSKGQKKSTGYYDNALQLAVCYLEKPKPSKGKQSQGAAPNIIHSLDAAHLMLITHNCDFPVTTVHDSFGCLLADMPQLYRITRESFVQLYEADPLKFIMDQIGGDLEKVQFGTLDIKSILESEYAFS